MDLRSFHIVFISCAGLLALGVGAWGLVHHARTGDLQFLVVGIASLAVAPLLAAYGFWVRRKLMRDMPPWE